jgi:hypothetical protein
MNRAVAGAIAGPLWVLLVALLSLNFSFRAQTIFVELIFIAFCVAGLFLVTAQVHVALIRWGWTTRCGPPP